MSPRATDFSPGFGVREASGTEFRYSAEAIPQVFTTHATADPRPEYFSKHLCEIVATDLVRRYGKAGRVISAFASTARMRFWEQPLDVNPMSRARVLQYLTGSVESTSPGERLTAEPDHKVVRLLEKLGVPCGRTFVTEVRSAIVAGEYKRFECEPISAMLLDTSQLYYFYFLNKAERAADKGDFKTARFWGEAAILLCREENAAYFLTAGYHLELNDREKVAECALLWRVHHLRYIRHDAEADSVGLTCLEHEMPEFAIEAFKKATTLALNEGRMYALALILFHLGWACEISGRLEEARKYLQDAMTYGRAYPDVVARARAMAERVAAKL